MAVRVLWLTKGLGPGGAERLLVEMARTRTRERVDVTAAYVLPWKDHLAGELEREGVRAICLSTSRPDPRWPLRLRRLITDGGFEVIHVHSPVPAVVARLVVRTQPRNRRPAIVSTEHNTWGSHSAATRWANRLTAGADAATLAVTEETRASLRGPAARRAMTLVHGVDIRAIGRHRRDRDAIRTELGMTPEDIVIGTVANYRAQKDYPNLLAAARLLVERGVGFRLVAVGQGPLEREITAQRDEFGLEAHVVLTGFRPDAARLMAAVDVFVLALAWEGLPVAVMEALALGLPIVATNVGGVAEALAGGGVDSGAAVLVAPGDPRALADALQEVVTDEGRRRRMAGAALEAARVFDVATATEAITTLYERVAPSRQDTPTAPAAPPASVPRSRPKSPPAEIRTTTAEDRDPIIALLGASLGWRNDERYRALYSWKHETNPFGASPGWVVEADGQIVAVRLFMRWEFLRGGAVVRAVRAVDTATHPGHQGRGLFTALTRAGLEACQADGIDFVFNTPNEQSRPGYLKMGWRQVGRLPTAVRPRSPTRLLTVARARTPAERWSEPLSLGEDVGPWVASGRRRELAAERAVPSSTDRTLQTRDSDAFATWRFSPAALHYRVVDDGDAAIVVRLRRRGPALELVVAEQLGDRRRADHLAGATISTSGADHAIRLGPPRARNGFLPLPGAGPILTWRAVTDIGQPPLSNWDLQLRDIELF